MYVIFHSFLGLTIHNVHLVEPCFDENHRIIDDFQYQDEDFQLRTLL